MSLFYECLSAFAVGGLLCVVAQLLIDLTRLTPARILVAFVVAGVALGAVGLYEPLYRFAGCGVSVPLLGFGGALARGVREADFQRRFGRGFYESYRDKVDAVVAKDPRLLTVSNEKVSLTDRGLYLSNAVINSII